MPEDYRRLPDGRLERALPLPESFGVTWERCWRARYRNGHGQRLARAFFYGWLDARALRALEVPNER